MEQFMRSCPPTNCLVLYLANDLDELDRTQIEVHVEDCVACQDSLSQLVLTDPGPDPDQLLSALTSVIAPNMAAEADVFIETLKRNVRNNGSNSQTASGPAALEWDVRPEVAGYEILDELGRGASGVVFRARDRELDRLVALKMIFIGPHMSADARRRLRIEAQAIARLRHPNIVQVYDVNESADYPYLALELVEGENLARWNEKGSRAPAAAVGLVATMAEAVAHAHNQGVIHRDLKPANVLLGRKPGSPEHSLTGDAGTSGSADYELKITDFGLARVLPGPGGSEARMTQSGMILGTPAYLAPEQAQGKTSAIGPATDIYSLGAILYELLTGRPPFLGDTAMEVLLRAAHESVLPPTRLVQRLPRELDTICLKCLEKDPRKRYSSASELAADLGRFLRHEPIKARPVRHLEKSVRWIRRHPAMMMLLAGNLMLAAILARGGLALITDRAQKVPMVEKERQDVARLSKTSAQPGVRDSIEHGQRDGRLTEWLGPIRISRATVAIIGNGPADTAAELRYRNGRADRRYDEAFRDAGLSITDENERAAAAQIVRSTRRDEILAGLDDWSVCTAEETRRRLLVSIARLVDPNPWRDRVRDSKTWHDRSTLAELERTARFADQPVSLLIALGERLQATGSDVSTFYQRVQTGHPTEFWANFALGNALNRTKPDDAANAYRNALAIRPRSSAVYNNLGVASFSGREWREGIGQFQKALDFDPSNATAHNNLGLALKLLGTWDEARVSLREAIRFDQKSVPAHYNFANIEAASGRFLDAITHYRHAVRLDPSFARAHYMLGVAVLSRAELEQSIDEHKRAILDDKINKRTYDILSGYAYDVARDRYSKALAFDPQWCPGHFELELGANEDFLDTAIESYKEAIRLDPEFAQSYGSLGQALLARGKLEPARTATRRSLDLLPLTDDLLKNLTRQLRRCEHLLVLEGRLPGVIKGTSKPVHDAERREFAELCDMKKYYVSAARLYAEVRAAASESSPQVAAQDRHSAVRAAILAGTGYGDESAALAETERTAWLDQARIWLRGELTAAVKMFDSGSTPERLEGRTELAKLQIDPAVNWLRKHDLSAEGFHAERPIDPTLWSDFIEFSSRALDPRRQGRK